MNRFIYFLLAVLFSAKTVAQPGSLDPSFGTGGKVVTPFDGSFDQISDISLFPDGRIFAAGSYINVSGIDTDFAMALYKADGSPDSSFGYDGLNITSTGGSEGITAVALQPDGKMLVAGTRLINSNSNLTVARYLPDASLDNDFGTFFGITQLDLGTNSDVVQDMVLLPDGKFVLAGQLGVANAADMMLVQFQSNGLVDSSFGTNGIVTTDFFGRADIVNAIVRQTDGKLLVAGRVYDTAANLNENFGLARYLPDGSPDSSFGTNGKVTIKFSGFIEQAGDLAVLPDGNILVAGHTQPTITRIFALARLLPDGSLDPSYGTGGKATQGIPGYAHVTSLVIQPDGKAIAGGFGNGPFLLARFTTEGVLDSTFTDGTSVPAGIVQTDFGTSFSEINALAMYPDGTLLAAGDQGTHFALARYITDSNVGIDRSPFQVGSVKIYPNPLEEKTTLTFTLPKSENVQINLLDSQGRLISAHPNQSYPAGNHELTLHFPTTLAEGLYIIQIITGSGQTHLKVWK